MVAVSEAQSDIEKSPSVVVYRRHNEPTHKYATSRRDESHARINTDWTKNQASRLGRQGDVGTEYEASVATGKVALMYVMTRHKRWEKFEKTK